MNRAAHIPLAPLTTFRIGGAARFFTEAFSDGEVADALSSAEQERLPTVLLGGGSNVLVPDEGFEGLVIRLRSKGITFEGATAVAEAGESWDALVEAVIARGLWGLENLSGIPGSVGGAVAGSIGAYGQSLSQTLLWAEALTREGVVRLTNAQCRFGYRESHFSLGESIVLRAAFALSPAPNPALSYHDLAERFHGQRPGLKDIRDAVLSIRAGKFPDLNREGTAGSFFKNPVVPREAAEELQKRYPALPLFSLPEMEGVKVPLAWILDKALGLKGFRMGRARLFERQPLVVVAERGCSAREVRTLAEEVSARVANACGLFITPEVKILSSR